MSGRPDRTRSNAQLNQKGEVNWKLWALGTGFLLFLIVVLQNNQTVKVKLLFVSTEAPADPVAGRIGSDRCGDRLSGTDHEAPPGDLPQGNEEAREGLS